MAEEIEALLAEDKVTVNVSSSSSVVSFTKGIVTVFVVSPELNVTVEENALKSLPCVAVPLEAAAFTVTERPEAALRETTTSTLFSSVDVPFAIDKLGVESSSVIVSEPWASAIDAFVAFERFTNTISSSSSIESARTAIGIVPVVAPAEMVIVFESAV